MEYSDPHHRHVWWPQRSKVKDVMWLRPFDVCLPITLQRSCRFRQQLPAIYLCFSSQFPGRPGLADARIVSILDFIGAKDDGGGGDN